MPWYLKISANGKRYRKNLREPNTEPWGTPHTMWISDMIDSIHVHCERSEKYDFINRRALPVIQTYFSNIVNKLLWSIVSKAADKSRSTRVDSLLLPIIDTISLYTRRKAVYVLWPHLYADWNWSIMALSSMCEIIRDATIFSIIFYKNDKFDTGPYFFFTSRPYFLIRGITIDDLHDKGKHWS